MSLLSFLDKKSEVSLLIHIGNSSVEGSLVYYPKETNPEVLYTQRIFFVDEKRPTGEELLAIMLPHIGTLLKKIMSEGFTVPFFKEHSSHISKVHITFSSLWYVSSTKQIHIEGDKAFVISECFTRDILEKEYQTFKNFIGESEYEEDFKGDLTLIENKILHTKINGYNIDTSIGRTTKTFDAFLCQSVISTHIVDSIFEVLFTEAHLSKDKVTFYTLPVVSSSIVQDLSLIDTTFLIISVTGEATEVTWIEEGVIMKTVSFPSGRNFILRQIGKNLNVSIEIAESMLHLFTDEKLKEDQAAQIQQIFSNSEQEWLIYFEEALLELSKKLQLPSKSFLIADPDVLSVYSSFINGNEAHNKSAFIPEIQNVPLSVEIFAKDIKNREKLFHFPYLAIFILFIKKIHQS